MNKRILHFLVLFLLFAHLSGSTQAKSKPVKNLLFAEDDDDMDLGERKTAKKSDDGDSKALELRKIVQSATKGQTTIQEAPAVITIMTEDDIHDYGFRNFIDLMNFIPSMLSANGQYDTMPLLTALGNSTSVLLIQDGISLFDPVYNIQATMRRWPLEIIKRVEVMSSPGGVLWGANSFMGITSVITKGADDINGVELGMGGGSGPGDQDVFRAYGMYGKSFGDLKVFTHLSGEFYRGPLYQYLPVRLQTAPPHPMSTINYMGGEEISSSAPMSFYGSFNGKINYKQFSLNWSLPFIGFPGFSRDLAKPVAITAWPIDTSSQVKSVSKNNYNVYDRFGALKFQDDIVEDKLSIDAKVYFTQFVREFRPMSILPHVPDTINGMAVDTTARGQRTGMNIDFNWNIGKSSRILFGVESFYEWIQNANATIIAPLDANGQVDYSNIPMSCPYRETPVYDPDNPENTTYLPGCTQRMIFDQDRFVLGSFVSAQHQFENKIIIDGGLRVQASPAGNVTYTPQLIPGASVVVPIAKNWFWKLNYLTGFRPPIFNNTGSNGRSIVYAGNSDIKVEKSQAFQTELNTILVKNKGSIQELSLRLNYGYTHLENFIRIKEGRYYNSSPRDIHSIESLVRLYLRGGHSFYFGYSFNSMYSGGLDGMTIRSVPNQWFNLAGVFKLTKDLDFISSLRIIGAYEDPNRVTNATNSSPASYVAYEKIPTAGLLSAGLRYKALILNHKSEFSLMTYNLTDSQSYYTADYFNDLSAQTETVPTKGQRFYFFVNSKIYF
ncbi:MAG: TonB-dependent receptor plug domain-containing protein [Myxococcota bacterium]